ncbi:MAG: VirB3 family type IV secretion system protein [Spirochaetaceae bacterium]|nr:VirB3 family type IV secretion system protein [Spirochaetaceae bacterium]
MNAYAQKVHRSLIPRDMLGGVPTAGLIFILLLSVVFLYVLGWLFMIAPIVLLYFVMRHLTKLDEWFIDIVLENIQEKDIYLP